LVEPHRDKDSMEGLGPGSFRGTSWAGIVGDRWNMLPSLRREGLDDEVLDPEIDPK
jgi:hypothetical protein